MTNDWLATKLGTRQWVVAQRLTPRLRDRGYTVAISPARYHAMQLEWERETYGATLAALEKAGPEMLRALQELVELNRQLYAHESKPDDWRKRRDAMTNARAVVAAVTA